jgi:hypothetical protein
MLGACPCGCGGGSWHQNLNANAEVSADQLFVASDPNGDAVTRYQLRDSTAGDSSGHFHVNGTVQAAEAIIEVLASELDNVTFVAGSEVGAADHVSVRAFDGKQWSDWAGLWITQT